MKSADQVKQELIVKKVKLESELKKVSDQLSVIDELFDTRTQKIVADQSDPEFIDINQFIGELDKEDQNNFKKDVGITIGQRVDAALKVLKAASSADIHAFIAQKLNPKIKYQRVYNHLWLYSKGKKSRYVKIGNKYKLR